MITYRSLKKLLGETSLERKCRFLFGVALMALISGSFWLHAARTRQLVRNQQVGAARTLVPRLLLLRHFQRFSQQSESVPDTVADSDGSNPKHAGGSATPGVPSASGMFDEFELLLSGSDEFQTGIQWNITNITDESEVDESEFEARSRFESGEQDEFYLFEETEDGSRSLRYIAAVRTDRSCLKCHVADNPFAATPYRSGQLVGVASVSLPMAAVDHELSRSRAILFGLAIVTTGLAVFAAYVIVRYIIVKPVLHLKDVSDAIAMGNLNHRAEINTGDEFEELSHAFNRMLRHMTTVNTELRGLNDNLDAKVDLLARVNLELFNSNRLKDDFLATISHELRTPLNSILGFSEILAKAGHLDDRQKRFVENIQTSGQNLMIQINDLLDLAKIESGQMKVQAGNCDVQELVNRLVQQVMPLAEQKNIDLRVTHPYPPLPQLHQDTAMLRQILTNLLSNAIKFTPEGGRVRVTSQLISPPVDMEPDARETQTDNGLPGIASEVGGDRRKIEVSVADTGIGIPLHEQEHIFEKFRQGSTLPGLRDHVKREFGGTGLGLSIVRELSRLLGGDVFLQSEFGKGSVFTVRLPAVFQPPKMDAPPTLESSSNVLTRITSVDLLKPLHKDASISPDPPPAS